ncbi:RAS associated with diabetes protein 51C [Striga asiatica]|uniref:RAS associated with diabetes protein 51C n=1 Tax=Striga asiatica TaxID=4170 RepID=A0A5A7R5C6_STRAF|nr:RAS associated with diabetes protein 51C [Striga asiatica]
MPKCKENVKTDRAIMRSNISKSKPGMSLLEGNKLCSISSLSTRNSSGESESLIPVSSTKIRDQSKESSDDDNRQWKASAVPSNVLPNLFQFRMLFFPKHAPLQKIPTFVQIQKRHLKVVWAIQLQSHFRWPSGY